MIDLNTPTNSDGIFVNKGTILSVTDISGTTIPGQERPVAVGIEVVLDIGKSFQPKIRVTSDWRLTRIFKDAGCTQPEGQEVPPLPQEWLDALVGKEVWRLSYYSGINPKNDKPRYGDQWDFLLCDKHPADTMREEFLKYWKKTGKPKQYLSQPAATSTLTTTTADSEATPF